MVTRRIVFHVHTAHTDGDGVIYFKDLNVIHAGDIMFNYLFPFIDLDNGGERRGLHQGAEETDRRWRMTKRSFIPGHGVLASKSDLETNLAVLVDGRQRVKALIDEGMSEEEIVAENPLADYHDEYNWMFITTERMTRTHYRDLTIGMNHG